MAESLSMTIRSLRKPVLALLLAIAAYLGVAMAWAALAFEPLMAGMPAGARAPLSLAQLHILLSVEDPRFFEHHGLSLADGQGAATITSALAREVYLSGRPLDGVAGLFQRVYRGVFACCKRIDLGRDAMALVLDAKLSKERQLALYVEHVYMGTDGGGQVRGLAQAAQRYAGKPLAQLTDDEFTSLVAMIKAPNQFHPVRYPQVHAQRVARIRALLAGACKPDGWFDTSFDACDPSSLAQSR